MAETDIKLIFLDIDGTLVGADGLVCASALTACREARRRGHILYICSGRPRSIIFGGILAAGFDGVISSGGAHIEKGNTSGEEPFRGEVLFDAVIEPGIVRRICACLVEKNSAFTVEKTDTVLSSGSFLEFLSVSKKRAAALSEAPPGEPSALDDLDRRLRGYPRFDYSDPDSFEGVNKIVFTDNGAISFNDVASRFSAECEIFHGSAPYCGREGGEIGPRGVHKGSALKFIAGRYGIGIDRTFAFGDSDNDRTMIELAGTGIAMGNADPELKSSADYVTDNIDADGIFNAFVKFGLI